MNNNGSVLFYGLMVAITILVVALALIPATKFFIDDARNDTTPTKIGLNCTNDSISTYDKMACRVSDISLFYFIGGLIFIAGAVVTAKIVFT